MKRKSIKAVSLITILLIAFFNACGPASSVAPDTTQITESSSDVAEKVDKVYSKSSYMVYYGVLNDDIIEAAKYYEIFILHPKMGDITREQVQEIRESGTRVLGYISIGEDLRTAGMTAEEMLKDERFIRNETGPCVDPRTSDTVSLADTPLTGSESPAGTGYASYYLDDNDYDGTPDFNVNFNCAFTNMGDPAWYAELNEMTLDGIDKMAGIREILTDDYGRGLGCDGLFLDTIDTCAPNSYTADSDPNKTRYEWTAAGVASFMECLKDEYPDKLICQNRGLFFYNPQLPQYKYTPREFVDFLMYESFMLDSNSTVLFNESFFADNKYNYAPKIIAEAGRPDGFTVLSLGYAEGPAEYELQDTLLGNSTAGMDILMEDINQTQNELGFLHYITDGGVTLVNNFVITHEENSDDIPPVWSSVYNASAAWPPNEPEPRVGIGQTEPIENGMIVRWDIALDRNDVTYTLYYQIDPFDFETDPDLKSAQNLELVPELGDGYADGINAEVYPYQAVIRDLDSGVQYYFIIRARDNSENEEKNTVTLTGVPGNAN